MKHKKSGKLVLLPVLMLSLALALRQVSMTMVMPFISTYCKNLTGYTSVLAGLAIGIFGLTQAIFQIPFGVLSDRFGNKKMMLIGLMQVIIGLLIAYMARNIMVLIIARALQGSGAIIGVAYSWTSSMVDESNRTKAMSIIGAFTSAGAALAFALGPLLHTVMPVNFMFLVCAVLLFINFLYIMFFIKDTRSITERKLLQKGYIRILFHNKNFVIMNFAAFINNFMMVSVFYAVPIYLDQVTGENGMWKVFVPAIVVAVFVLRVSVAFADRGFNRSVILISFFISSLSMLFFFRDSSYLFLLIGTSIFMSGYISIAAIVAAIVNNVAQDAYRGTVNGIFNSFQYIGNFVGALAAGAIWGFSEISVWILLIGLGLIGCVIIALSHPVMKSN